MRVVQRLGDLDGMSQDLIGRQRATVKAVSDGIAFHQLHHEVVATVLLAHIVKRADMRVIQLRNGSRFALEPFVGRPVANPPGQQHLDRHFAIRRVSLARCTSPMPPARARR